MKKTAILFLFVSFLTWEARSQDIKWLNQSGLSTLMYSKFHDGLVILKKQNKFGCYDTQGNLAIPFVYDWIWPFEDGQAIAQKNGRWGIINTRGAAVVPLIYEDISGFQEGLCGVKKNGKWGFLNDNGDLVIAMKYDDIGDFSSGLAPVMQYNKWGYINKSGQVVIQINLDDTFPFIEGLAKVKRYNKWGFINTSGRVVISHQFDDVTVFKDGLCAVQKNDKWGYIDKQGNLIIPFKYQEARGFSQGLACVQMDEKSGFINRSGRLIVPYIYDDAYSFSEGVARVDKYIGDSYKSGFINQKGQVIIPIIYDAVSDCFDGAVAVKDAAQKWGAIDKYGRQILPIEYNYVYPFREGYSLIQKGSRYGILKNPAKDLPSNETAKQKVSIVWLSPNPDISNNKNYQKPRIHIKLKAVGDPSIQRSDFQVYINNQRQVSKSGEMSLLGTTFTSRITLKEGKNDIQVRARHHRSKTLTVYYSATKPTLHLLAIAPNFEKSYNSQTLKYTDDDARDIIRYFQSQKGKGIYQDVKTTALIGNNATAAQINKAVERLKMQYMYKDIHQRDIVIVFASSHGFMQGNRYYIKGDDYDPYSPMSTSVASQQLMAHLAQIKCKKLLFIDACYSGGTARDDNETRAINETIKALTNRQRGIATFTSSTGSQKSYEHDAWRNGAFTYAITQALNGKADTNRDRKITINELHRYLKLNVPQMVRSRYNELQTPQLYTNGLDGDLPIFVW